MGQIKKLLKFQEPTISGLKVIPLKEISDNRGSVLHMLSQMQIISDNLEKFTFQK